MKIFVLKKRLLIQYLLLFSLAAILFVFGSNGIQTVFTNITPAKHIPIYCVDRSEKVVSLTFNAAWGNGDIPQLMDTLSKYKIKTTFFVVGDWADRFPESLKSLHEAGHEIMNHSNTHPHMNQLSAEKIRENVKRCDDKVEAITGKKPFLFRPPYGEYNELVVQTLSDMGHYTIQWDVDSLDWQNISADSVFDRVTKKVKNGSIVLFHTDTKYTPAALPRIIETLQQKGYKIVPVSELIYRQDYYIDYSGKQIHLNNQKPPSE